MHRSMTLLAAVLALLAVPAAAAPRDAGHGGGRDAGARAAYDTNWATLPPEPGPAPRPAPAPSKLGDDGPEAPVPAPAPATPAPQTRIEPAQPSGPKEAAQAAPSFPPEVRKAAREHLQGIWKLAEKGPLPCEKVVDGLTRKLLIAADFDSSDVAAHPMGYVALARCAEARGFYGLMGNLGLVLYKYGKRNAHPEILARAVLGLGAADAAWKILLLAEKDFPDDPDVAVTKAKVLCRVRRWPECHAQAERTLALAKGMRDKSLQGSRSSSTRPRGRSRGTTPSRCPRGPR